MRGESSSNPPVPDRYVDDARRLVDRAAANAEGGEIASVTGARACESMVGSLAIYVGLGGAHALFDRSLVLSARERPWLSDALPSRGPSGWERLRACLATNEASAREASIALIATLVALFVALVGARVTTRILREHWPDVFLSDPTDDPAEYKK